MGRLLMFVALVLPVVSGALRWPWWMILVCGLVAIVGYFLTYPWALARVRARGGLSNVIAPMVTANSAACAALFWMGHLLARL
jgi:hypothetical protein